MPRDDAYLLDMLLAARRLVARFAGVLRTDYDVDEDAQAISFWLVSVIGEAAGRVTEPTRKAHPEIPWSRIKGARNAIIHGYDQINPDKVWEMITDFAPQLIRSLEQIVPNKEEYE